MSFPLRTLAVLFTLILGHAFAAETEGRGHTEPALATEDATQQFRLQKLYAKQKFDCPVALAVVPGDVPRLALLLQRGEVWLLPEDEVLGRAELFLDFREAMKKVILLEEGCHGLAFHPEFASNGKFYVSYSSVEPRRNVLSEMQVELGNHAKADASSERVLLELPHIMANHFAGGIAFGPDKKLYMTIGDGGLRDDPYRLAQNPWSLNGKMLRLDVDTRSGNLAYGIPADNPFADKQEYRPEIWALGLRNPWGFAFDKETGDLWLADVGQDIWEEVNIVRKGLNYGWSDRDGPRTSTFQTSPFLPDRTYEDPVFAYTHAEGISITGGFVYRGERLPQLKGCFIYADWGYGTVYALRYEPDSKTIQERILLFRRSEEGAKDKPFNPTVIAADLNGEILIFSQEGAGYTIVQAD